MEFNEIFAYKQDLFKDDENEDENEDAIQKEASLEDNGESKLVDEDDEAIEKIAEKVESDLFLDGDDDELEDLDELEKQIKSTEKYYSNDVDLARLSLENIVFPLISITLISMIDTNLQKQLLYNLEIIV